MVTTSEFDQVKARLAAIENRNKLKEEKEDKDKPTLRRTAQKSDKDKDGKQTDDDRPTLKKRD